MKRRFSKIIAAAMAISLLLGTASCSKKDSSKEDEGAPLEVTVGITQEPSVFDPHTVVAAGDKEIIFNVFEGLYKFDSNGNLNPCLATGVVISDDATEYTFSIREGVTFHNGNAMDADDVVYSLERASEYVPNLAGIESISKTDDGKVVVKLSEADSELLSYFTTAIIPDEVEDISADLIGTGPYKFDSYNIGESVVLTKNEEYWLPEIPYADKIIFKICSDMDSGFIELQNGSIDIFPYLTNEKAQQLDPEQFDILSRGSNMVQVLALNNAVSPLDDVNVRYAINYAIDREELINLTMDGQGLPLTTGMSPVMGDAYDKEIDGTYDKNVELAKEYLKEAGLEDGFELTITVPSNYLIHVNTAVAIADQLSAVGIKCTIEQVDWATWLEDVYQGRNYEATVIAITSDYAPYDVMSRYDSENGGNFINYSNEEYDSIIRAIPLTASSDEKISMYHELCDILTADAASCYIQDPYNIVAVNKRITGYNLYPMYVQDMSTVRRAE